MYQFAIKKDQLKSGKIYFTPVARRKRYKFISSPWVRIVDEYGRYMLRDLDWIPDLTYQECVSHINGFKLSLKKIEDESIDEITYDMLEENPIDQLRIA